MVQRNPIGIIKTRAVILHEGKIFLGKINPFNFYCLPGGTLELGEDLKTGLARELMEELGVEAEIGPLVYTQEIIREGESKFDFWYWVKNPEDFLNVDLATASHGYEHLEVGFYDPRNLDAPVRPERIGELLDIWNAQGPVFVQQLGE